MNPTSVDQAISQFRSLAAQAGFVTSTEASQQHFGSSVVRIVAKEAELRLVWDGSDERLYLQVSHGPSSGPSVGWLDIFGCQCVAGALVDPGAPEVSFRSSVMYGLELMSPNVFLSSSGSDFQ